LKQTDMKYSKLLIISLTLFPCCDYGMATNLASSIKTRTNVHSFAEFGYDLRDMKANCDLNDIRDAVDIYRNGKNAKDGETTFRSLKKCSTIANSADYLFEPTFAFQMYGLAGGSVENYMNHATFADDYVEQFFSDNNGISCHYAVEAALNLNLWTHAAHKLWQGSETCAKVEQGQLNLEAAGIDFIPYYDQFLAMWIGFGQKDLGTSKGHSLYANAQKIGDKFGTTSPQSSVNTNILSLYERASGLLSTGCSNNLTNDAANGLWKINTQIISQMMIPHIQHLIEAMKMNDSLRVKLYATIVLPQMSQCRRSTFNLLKKELLDQDFHLLKFSTLLHELQTTYECFGVTCRDIGTYNGDPSTACHDPSPTSAFAGYIPSTNVRQQAKIDLDIHQMDILLDFDNDAAWNIAKNIYWNGKNSMMHRDDTSEPLEFRSLRIMANFQFLSSVSFYNYFTQYFNETHYAHAAIMDSFDNLEAGLYTQSKIQRKAVILKTIQTHVIWMQAVAEMGDALQDCQNGNRNDNDGNADGWDEVAAYLIGSLEGPATGGSAYNHDGQLIWNIANKFGFDFGRDNSDNYAITNAFIRNLLLAGKGEIFAGDCNNLFMTMSKLQHITLIPMIQGVIKYAVLNENLSFDSQSTNVATGVVFAKSILPIVDSYDASSALMIKANLIPQEGQKLVREGPQAVVDAFLPILHEFGIECNFIGKYKGIDPCKNYVYVQPENPNPINPGSGAKSLTCSLLLTFISVAVVFLTF